MGNITDGIETICKNIVDGHEDRGKFIRDVKKMPLEDALEAIFVATTKKQLSFSVFRIMIARLGNDW